MRRRRPPRRRGSTRRQLLVSALIGLLLGALVIRCCNATLRPAVITVASDHLSNQVSGEICDVVNAYLEAEDITYSSICTVQRDSAGNITALETDMARLSRLQNAITTQVAQAFDDSLVSLRVTVPVGNLLPGMAFTGRGPSITVVVQSVGNISAAFENEFIVAGINQTLHQVVLTVSAQLTLLLPGGVYTYDDATKIILAETVLLGDVPDSYTYFSQYDSAEEAYESYYHYGARED